MIKIYMEVNFIKDISVQEWLPIDKIFDDGIIKLKNNKYIKILKIIPINYNLKSDLEKNAILNSYKIFLKTCNFNIQILIQSNKENLDKHIFNIKKNLEKNKKNYIQEISENYINYINKLNSNKKSSSKNFYIIIESNNNNFYKNNNFNKNKKYVENYDVVKNDLKEKYFKIKECLSRCGNSVINIEKKDEILKIIFSFLNTRKDIKGNNKFI